jgi:hypothetical protein
MKVDISVNRATRVASATITFVQGEASPQPVRVDWGDGSVQTLASGFTNPTTHTYAKVGNYEVSVQGNEVRATQMVPVGDQLRAYDPDKFTKTPAQMQERERSKAAQIAGQVRSGTVGGP